MGDGRSWKILSEFPNLQAWIDYYSAQGRGAIMVALIALAGFTWLVMARSTWPKLLPIVRVALVGAFYLSLVVLLLIGVRNV